MNKQEFMKVFGKDRDLTELKITGALDAAKYKKMSKDEVQKFLERDVAELAKKFIHEAWTDIVNVRFEYVLVDSYLNKQGSLQGYLNYTHEKGATDCTYEFKK